MNIRIRFQVIICIILIYSFCACNHRQLSQKYMHNSNMGMGDMKDEYHIRFVRKGGSDRNWNARVVFDKKEDVDVLYTIFKNIRKYVRK